MVNYAFDQTEIKSIWRLTKNKRYSIQSFIHHGCHVKFIIFDDMQTGKKCTGKVVTKFLEGEIYHWPRLHHNSLAPLLDVIYIDERLSICMTTHLTYTLRDIIHSKDFINDPLNFDKKKAYIEDILLGLDYIHYKDLSLMNVSDANVLVCPQSDKVVIANFTCLVTVYNASKHRKCAPYMYRAPELSVVTPFEKKMDFDPISTDIWSIGVMIMEVFLCHGTPWGLVDYDPSLALEVAFKIDWNMLKNANKGSPIDNQSIDDLKRFLGLFLNKNPKNRCSAYIAVSESFIQNRNYRRNLKNLPQSMAKQRKTRDSYELCLCSSEGYPVTKINRVSMPILDCESMTLSRHYSKTTYGYLNESPVTDAALKNAQHTSSTKGSKQSKFKIREKSFDDTNSVPHVTSALVISQIEGLSENDEFHFDSLPEQDKNGYSISDPQLSNDCDLQHVNKQEHCQNLRNPFSQDEAQKLIAKTTYDSKHMVENCDKQSDGKDTQIETRMTLDEDKHFKKLMFYYPIADQIKKPNIKNKSAIVASQVNNTIYHMDAWSERMKPRNYLNKDCNYLNKDLINSCNYEKPKLSRKETSKYLWSRYENETSFEDKECLEKSQGLNDTEENEASITTSNDSHSSSAVNLVFPEPATRPRQINIIKHRRGCSHHSQKGKKKSQRNKTLSQKTASIVLSTKQKCKVSLFLLNAGDKNRAGTVDLQQQSEAKEIFKDGVKRNKRKAKNCFCF